MTADELRQWIVSELLPLRAAAVAEVRAALDDHQPDWEQRFDRAQGQRAAASAAIDRAWDRYAAERRRERAAS